MRTEEALDASATEAGDLPRRAIPRRSLSPDREDDDDDDEEDMLSGGRKEDLMKKKRLQQPFNPFCNVEPGPGVYTLSRKWSQLSCVCSWTSVQ